MDNSITILMATYNGDKFIKAQLESLLKQTYTSWKCYIHDDGSIDHTNKILEHYNKSYPDRFIVLKYPKCGGAKNNFLSLLKSDRTGYVMFSDQDDVWESTKIEDTLMRMKKLEINDKGKPLAVFTDLYLVDQNLAIISESFFIYSKHNPKKLSVNQLFVGNPAPGCTMMINGILHEMAASYKNSDNIEMHDWWCMVIAAAFGKIGYLDKPTIMYRQHGANTLGAVNRCSPKYYVKLMISIFTGKRISETRGRIVAKRKMAKEIYSCFQDESGASLLFIKELALIEKKAKWERMKFYLKNNLYGSFLHVFWIMISC